MVATRRAQFSASMHFHPLFFVVLSEESGVKRNIYVSFNDHDSLKIAGGWKEAMLEITFNPNKLHERRYKILIYMEISY